MTPIVIDKLARREGGFHRPYRTYPNARSAFRSFLQAADFQPGDHVLLPAFIGWSAREGSGVFDPVRELGLPCAFYGVDETLSLDLDDLGRQLSAVRARVVVLIHYFGRVDPRFAEAAALARSHGALVLEDSAHALFTDQVGGICGGEGEATIFSLHKMLPVSTGGMLLWRPGAPLPGPAEGDTSDVALPWSYDLQGIARRRVENADALRELLRPLAGEVDPLWDEVAPGTVLQTFPVIVRRRSRDQLYFAMNEAGFGVVSLYHTLIDQLRTGEHSRSEWLARHILNLPVHQDATGAELGRMVDALGEHVLAADVVAA